MRHASWNNACDLTGMRVTGPFAFDSRGVLKTLATLPRICEKSSASSALDQQPQDFNAEHRRTSAPMRIELVSQEETPRFDPFWDGPKLLPAFVAQVMGQMMPERRDAQVSVETAYGSVHDPRMALVLDRKS
jgi:hypothetical protein